MASHWPPYRLFLWSLARTGGALLAHAFPLPEHPVGDFSPEFEHPTHKQLRRQSLIPAIYAINAEIGPLFPPENEELAPRFFYFLNTSLQCFQYPGSNCRSKLTQCRSISYNSSCRLISRALSHTVCHKTVGVQLADSDFGRPKRCEEGPAVCPGACLPLVLSLHPAVRRNTGIL
jgi:hypothetical protein